MEYRAEQDVIVIAVVTQNLPEIAALKRSFTGILLGLARQELSRAVGSKVVIPGAVLIMPVFKSKATPTVLVTMITGITCVGTVVLAGFVKGEVPTMTPV